MALGRAITKRFTLSLPARLQVRFNSDMRSKDGVIFGSQRIPQAVLHVPVINGDAVFFPLQDSPQHAKDPGSDCDLGVPGVTALRPIAQHSAGSGSSCENSSGDALKGFLAWPSSATHQPLCPGIPIESAYEDALKGFEVAGSRDIAARLFQNIELLSVLARRRKAQKVVKIRSKIRERPSIGNHMAQTFGSAENVVALVCRFARMAYDIGRSEASMEKHSIVSHALQDVLGRQALDRSDIAPLVHAISEALQLNSPRLGSLGAPEIIRYLSFENVWQKLGIEQRQLITDGFASGKMTSDGLVDGVTAFEKSWQNFSCAQKELAKQSLRCFAQNYRAARIQEC